LVSNHVAAHTSLAIKDEVWQMASCGFILDTQVAPSYTPFAVKQSPLSSIYSFYPLLPPELQIM
jgi:hypothetical protein